MANSAEHDRIMAEIAAKNDAAMKALDKQIEERKQELERQRENEWKN